jgi:hypothetical protein
MSRLGLTQTSFAQSVSKVHFSQKRMLLSGNWKEITPRATLGKSNHAQANRDPRSEVLTLV